MKFDYDDSAYEFYKQYAHGMGFNVRKQYIRRGSAGHVKRRTFLYIFVSGHVKRKQYAYFYIFVSMYKMIAI